MDQPKIKTVYENIGKLSRNNINFYVFWINIKSCKNCQTELKHSTKLEKFSIFVTHVFELRFMKTKYLLYFKIVLPKLRFEWLYYT